MQITTTTTTTTAAVSNSCFVVVVDVVVFVESRGIVVGQLVVKWKSQLFCGCGRQHDRFVIVVVFDLVRVAVLSLACLVHVHEVERGRVVNVERVRS